METTTPNMSAKALLGKLLATENITVQQQPVPTAMFDVESRTLTLPLWTKMGNTLTDMLIGHEVGHAIFTPTGGDDLEKTLESMDPSGAVPMGVRMDYLNVVEDARIERLMQEKFAGMRRDFRVGYADLVERDFFGIEGRDTSDMQFIDRVNLHYKIGSMVEIEFTDEERQFIDMIDACDTFEEVVAAATAMMQYADAKKRAEQPSDMGMPQQAQNGGDEQGQAEGDGQSKEGQTGEGGQASGDSIDGDGDDRSDSPSSNGRNDSSEGGSNSGLTRSETMQSLEKHLTDDCRDGDPEIDWVTVPDRMDLSQVIVPYTNILARYQRHMVGNADRHTRDHFARFQKESAKIVNNMVKRFEMKKAADECKRAEQSQTGILDPLKMVNYRWEEDIFLRTTDVQEGKSHGLVMFVDWSGSMCENIYDTVRQTLVLAMFCQKVGIPFDVYAFTNGMHRWYNASDQTSIAVVPNPKVGDLSLFSGVNFMNVLSSDCKRSDFNTLAAGLLTVARGMDYNHAQPVDWIPDGMGLSGTPLDDQILAARQILIEFKAKHGIQIVNAVFLTDGVSNESTLYHAKSWNGTEWTSNDCSRRRGLRASDGTMFGIPGRYLRRPATEVYLEWLRYETGIAVIGIYLTTPNNGDRHISHARNETRYVDSEETKRYKKQFFDNGAVAIPNCSGYSEYIVMASESKKKIKGLDDLDTNAKPAVVANAMIREAKKRKAFTKIMDIFVDRISKEFA